MQDITLSLVIPTYNRANLISETIESAFRQTQPFAEIIIIDDGSTDDTMNFLSQYLGKVRVIRTPNQGVQNARNIGVAAAMSSHVTLCDSDDVLEPEFVACIKNWLENHQECQIIYSNFVTFDEINVYSNKFSQAPDGFFLGSTTKNNFITDVPDLYIRTLNFQPLFSSGVSIEKKFYQELCGFDIRLKGIGSEDWEFTLRAISKTNAALCKIPLVRIRKHAANDSRDTTRQNLGEALVLEHALQHHPIAQRYISEIMTSIEKRRLSAFNGAFAAGDFELSKSIINSSIKIKSRNWKFLVKRIIIQWMPTEMKTFLLRVL